MALETGTYISDLVATNPVGATDTKATLDDHIRLVKSTVKATFPNISGAVTPTHTELNYVDGVTSAIQTQIDAKAPKASPTFTGVPVAPTAAVGTATTQLATCEFVDNTAFAVASGLTAASQAEMEAGTEAALRTMSPLRVAQAISALASTVNPAFGSGIDGDVTVSAGTTTLTRNMYYNNLTINGTGSIDAAGYQIFVMGTLDLTAAPAGAIKRIPQAGGNAAAGAAGAAASALAEVVVGGAGTGLIGKAASATASTQAVKDSSHHGGLSGATKTAGTSSTAVAGGAGAAKPAAVTTATHPTLGQFILAAVAGLVTLARGGTHGAGGPSGGNNAGNAGGGGGGGGSGGGVLDIRAATISRGASTTAGAISVVGGAGGNGGIGNAAGGGGGSGGAGAGGGFIQIVYSTLSGATATNCLDVSGGRGGDGGAGGGAGLAGQGADGGDGGRVRIINTTAGTVTENVSAVTGSANVTTTGGAGAVARYDL